MKKVLFSLSILSTLLFSCKEEDTEPTSTTEKATVRFKIQHYFNDVKTPFNLTDEFVNANGDTIKFKEFKYFLSNAILRGDSIDPLVLDNSYYLVEVTDSPIQNIEITDLDPAVYSSFEISLGIDSLANHSVVNNSGDLSPSSGDGMFWLWDIGYKFLLMEGTYKNDTVGEMVLHLGKDSNYQTFEFGTEASSDHTDNGHDHTGKIADDEHGHTEGSEYIELKEGKVTEIHLMVNVAELFVSPDTINLRTYNPGHAGGSEILNNAKHSTDDTKNGWFGLHHITTE